MEYNSTSINSKFETNMAEVKKAFSSLSFKQTEPIDKLLKGWVFEQTISNCLQEEFNNKLKIIQQYKLSTLEIQEKIKSRAVVDLVVDYGENKIFIEIKHSGVFKEEDIDKYDKYRKLIESNGFKYFYLSKEETYRPYKEKCKTRFGIDNAFFLDEQEDWERFINSIKKALSH